MTDWKSVGIMAGISGLVFIVGTIVNYTLVEPAVAKARLQKAEKEAQRQAEEAAEK